MEHVLSRGREHRSNPRPDIYPRTDSMDGTFSSARDGADPAFVIICPLVARSTALGRLRREEKQNCKHQLPRAWHLAYSKLRSELTSVCVAGRFSH